MEINSRQARYGVGNIRIRGSDLLTKDEGREGKDKDDGTKALHWGSRVCGGTVVAVDEWDERVRLRAQQAKGPRSVCVPAPVLPGARWSVRPLASTRLFFWKFWKMRDRLGLLTRWAASPSLSYPTPRSFSLSFVALASRKKRMPPKKAPPQEKKVLLGRPSNNLKIGIVGTFPSHGFSPFIQSYSHPVGLPNVGKSSFFNALSQTGKPKFLLFALHV